MKPTALTEAIKQIDADIEALIDKQNNANILDKAVFLNERIALIRFKKVLIALLPKDRQDIEEAFRCGGFLEDCPMNASDYFTLNYTQEYF